MALDNATKFTMVYKGRKQIEKKSRIGSVRTSYAVSYDLIDDQENIVGSMVLQMEKALIPGARMGEHGEVKRILDPSKLWERIVLDQPRKSFTRYLKKK